jgi:protein gp37
MGDRSRIEWCDATWNVLVGCSPASTGCDNCYAVPLVHRGMAPQHRGLTVRGESSIEWTGEVREVREMLDRPLRWTRPRRIFVNSLSDLFHPEVRTEFIVKVFAVMALAPQHTFQVLTKRPHRMASVLGDADFAARVTDAARRMALDTDRGGLGAAATRAVDALGDAPLVWPLPNVWLGTSIESDRFAFRARELASVPAALRWVSAEPLLEALPSLDLTDIDWLVVGGESGHGARPMHPAWVRDLRDRAAAAGVPFVFKQWGSWAPRGRLVDGEPLPVDNDATLILNVAGNTRGRAAGSLSNRLCEFPDGSHCEVMERVAKSDAGRTLDGELYDGYPAEPWRDAA